jgi:N-methylhydantoinase A/acetophenone carboxylase
MREVVVFPFSSTFCAYGSSTMDVLHVYERSRHFTLLAPGRGAWLRDYDGFNATVEELRAAAVRDFSGEGFDAARVTYELELDMKFGGQLNVKRVASPLLAVSGEADMKALYSAFETEFSEAYSSLGLHPDAGVEIEAFVLKARLPQAPPPRVRGEADGAGPGLAAVEHRPALFTLEDGRVDTPVYAMADLRPGDRIAAPALVESEDTTIVVAPGWELETDEHRAMVLRRGEAEASDV